MPQADKMAFFLIVFWTFTTFGTGYLFLNSGIFEKSIFFVTLSPTSKKRFCCVYRAALKLKKRLLPRLRLIVHSLAPVVFTVGVVFSFDALEVILTEEDSTFSFVKAYLEAVSSQVSGPVFSPFLMLFFVVSGFIARVLFRYQVSTNPGFFWWKRRYAAASREKNSDWVKIEIAAIRIEYARLQQILKYWPVEERAERARLHTEISRYKWDMYMSCLRSFMATGASRATVLDFQQKLLKNLFPSYVLLLKKHAKAVAATTALKEILDKINHLEAAKGVHYVCPEPPCDKVFWELDLSPERAWRNTSPTEYEGRVLERYHSYRQTKEGQNIVVTNPLAEIGDAVPEVLQARFDNDLNTDLTPVIENEIFASIFGPSGLPSTSSSFPPFQNPAPSAPQLDVASVPSNQTVFQVQQGFQPAVPLSNMPALPPTGPLPVLPSGTPLALPPAPELPSKPTGGCWVDSLEAQRPPFFLESEHLTFLNDCFLIFGTCLHIALIMQPSWFYIVLSVKLRYFQLCSYLSALKNCFW